MASPPPLHRLVGELRAATEFARYVEARDSLRRLQGGDRQAVIVFPGLMAADWWTAPMRGLLTEIGYFPHGWELGLNLGLRPGLLPAMEKQVRIVHEGSRRTVSLIGWSLGGLYAREIAKRMPDKVRQVITIGTPFMGDLHDNRAWRLYELVAGHKVEQLPIETDLEEHPPVPTTSVYSRNEGIVAPESCIGRPGPLFENIEISGSHVGMPWNPAILRILANRLAQPEGSWQPYR